MPQPEMTKAKAATERTKIKMGFRWEKSARIE